MKKLIAFAAVAAMVATVAASSAAASGATQTIETWTNQTQDLFYNGEFCTGQTVAGYPVESGIVRITETANGGSYDRGRAEGTIDLYEAFGPPWDVTFGAFVGTLTYHVAFDDEIAPGGQGALGGLMNGQIVYADGTSQHFGIVFRLVLQPEGPPRLFLVQIICGG